MLADVLAQVNETTIILLSLSVILLAGFMLTRITKLAKLPNVTGYILAGIAIGPHALNLIPRGVVANMGFISDIALAFIAFGVGRFLTRNVFRETGWGAVMIALAESVAAGVLITLTMRFFLHLDWGFSMLLGAIAMATAPASTMATIRQYRARGAFVNILLQVVALDNALCLAVFGVVIAFINAGTEVGFSPYQVVWPLLFNVIALLLGLVSGFVLSKMMTPGRSEDNRLILATSLLLGVSGLCAAVDVSPLLACMLLSAVYVNLTGDKELYRQVDSFTPPIMSMFFVVSGMNLDISAFKTLGLIGATYFLVRVLGKHIGAYVGCLAAKTPKPIRDNLSLALIPQAGVAIGLAFLGKRMLPDHVGDMLLTIVLSSSVLYELVGPACAKFGLVRSGAISKEALANEGRRAYGPEAPKKEEQMRTSST